MMSIVGRTMISSPFTNWRCSVLQTYSFELFFTTTGIDLSSSCCCCCMFLSFRVEDRKVPRPPNLVHSGSFFLVQNAREVRNLIPWEILTCKTNNSHNFLVQLTTQEQEQPTQQSSQGKGRRHCNLLQIFFLLVSIKYHVKPHHHHHHHHHN